MSHPLEHELQMVVNCLMLGLETNLRSRNSKCSYLMSHHPSPQQTWSLLIETLDIFPQASPFGKRQGGGVNGGERRHGGRTEGEEG